MASPPPRGETPVIAEIASLLDQCSPDELSSILSAIDAGNLLEDVIPGMAGADPAAQAPSDTSTAAPQPPAPTTPTTSTAAAAAPTSPKAPVPPPGPAPGSRRPMGAAGATAPVKVSSPGGPAGATPDFADTAPPIPGMEEAAKQRRTVHHVHAQPSQSTLVDQADGSPKVQRPAAAPPPPAPPPAATTPQGLTSADMQRLLEEHKISVLSEVRKMVSSSAPAPQAAATTSGYPMPPAAGTMDGFDLAVLTATLSDRDREVKALENRLAELQTHLSEKDKRVAELGVDLDTAVREVRHRQLDLEFQQLKLEERVRTNADLEQQQRNLTMRVEEASLNARHAALDADMCRNTPRSVRVQGSLPWTLRKGKQAAMPMQ
eukprot:gnl/TRDRNA2_/TRDRNA2_59894_c0_seq1.p1 gnl/TRDRNA2_/TRDRNA2_59894_c0~~gnl/TRDRNA2_/TRDRNA2_59894_c0_seq1.p1  ORF type:complete len:376 (-),score=87.15 gnl/TRDRNA2_/TRDRNA2_59894_c0_seq1:414-1541(-)